jgi:hypothetical protein
MAFISMQAYRLYHDKAQRTPATLINQYYRLSKTNPDAAKRALILILAKEPMNIIALRELGFWYLKQGDVNAALRQFEKAHAIYPDDVKIANQLRLLENMLGVKSTNKISEVNTPHTEIHLTWVDWNNDVNKSYQQRLTLFLSDLVLPPMAIDIPLTSAQEKRNISTSASATKLVNQISTVSVRDKLLNEFYQNKSNSPMVAWHAMDKLLLLYPDDLIALKEAGYYALGQDKKALSVDYFKRAYIVSQDPYLALQIGYILDGLNKKREAYHYFDLATLAIDQSERLKAELAKTNLRGIQTRFLPDNYFANILFYPFYQSRFKLLIYPLIARVGVLLNEKYHVSTYVIYRRTSDNKSVGTGQLPQIYEDNAAITSLGIQASPFPSIPLVGFVEAGKSVDLVYKNRARWRNDFRYGLLYYNEWGREARYSFTPTFTLKPNMDIYGDLIYFSRYLNTIGTMRLRPGIELLRFGSTSLNFYLKVFLSQDQSRIFYNNILDVGPSLAFTPSDRYNVTIRYECLRGYYLPSAGSSSNPYGSTYHNNMIFIDTYAGF